MTDVAAFLSFHSTESILFLHSQCSHLSIVSTSFADQYT
jgi:hypothetical protein